MSEFEKLNKLGSAPSSALTGTVRFFVDSTGAPKIIDESGTVSPASGSGGNLLLSGNTLSSQNSNGDITVDPNGTGAINLAANSVLLQADAVAALGAATKQQLDAAINGVDVKEGVVAATTANITLSGAQTIDGVSVVATNRVLVKNQTTPANNGIYVAASGSWTRATDADSSSDLSNALVTVQAGTANGNTGWYQSTENPVIGTDSIVFTQFFGAGTYTASGQGVVLTGSTFSLQLDGSSLSQSASGVKVNSVSLTSQVSGTLPIANGGTNSATTLNNNRMMQSSGGAVVEAPIISANKAIRSDANGIVGSATTTATELDFVSGVTSAIQTQLNGKQSTGNYITALTGDVAASGPGSAAASIQSGVIVNSMVSSSAAIAGSKIVSAASGVSGVMNTVAQTVTGAKTFETQLIGMGTATNDNAATGYIGEIQRISRSAGTALTFTSGTTTNMCNTTSITLTAGDWEISGLVYITLNTTTTLTQLIGGVSTVSATLPSNADAQGTPQAGEFYNQFDMPSGVLTGQRSASVVFPNYRFSTSSSATLYLVGQATFAISTATGWGFLEARRVR